MPNPTVIKPRPSSGVYGCNHTIYYSYASFPINPDAVHFNILYPIPPLFAIIVNVGLFFIIEFEVVPEEAVVAERLISVALPIFCDLGLILNAVTELEDEIIFAC